MKVIQFISDYWPVLVAIGAVLDALAGYLPDKWVPYIGIIKRGFVALKNLKK